MDERFTQPLKERGIRVTPQRAYIWRALVGSGRHFTAEELREQVEGVLPGLEVSTVYRTLEALNEAGLVVESRLPEGPRVFEANPTPHPHLVCERCDNLFHLETADYQRMLKSLNREAAGFEIRELHVLGTGLCADCARHHLDR
jgi:Fe2+ or Zn2+ uptake regulation protein